MLAELRSGRWVRRGRQTVSAFSGTPDRAANFWIALLEVGEFAALDGVTALEAAGLDGFDEPTIHVSVPKSSTPRRASGVRVHERRRRRPDDLEQHGVRRTRADVAAIRGALWAVSDRQAALILVMSVQQGLTTPEKLAAEMTKIRRARRRKMMLAVVADLGDGVRSLGELDFARICRRTGLPEPERQSLRRLTDGVAYLDVEWRRYGVVVEIDGIHHAEPRHIVADALRQNDVSRDGALVIRVPVVGLRSEPDRFVAQIRAALLSRGWQPNRTATSAEVVPG
ncbi:MAG TPA: hypothetical protein VFB74_31950 [Kribbellaceae bacterium]|nr:hypothetical protein [Kribbellaceae bacterium]